MRVRAPGDNALYVLRMVLSGRPATPKRFSTAVVDREKDQTAWTGSSLFPGLKALASRSASEEEVGAVNFLEEEGQEYQAVRTALPARSSEARPIPWPTIFAHHEQPAASTSTSQTQTKAATRVRPCDPIARLVEDGDLVAARKVYDDLRALRMRVEARAVYLDAARQCLSTQDMEGFFFWLKLFPNRPATLNHPGLKATWEPITSAVVDSYPFDLEVLEQYAMACARKGVLPATVHSLIRHFAYVAPPETSRLLVEDTLSEYVAATTSATSTSSRAQKQRQLVDKQVGGWREAYRQAVQELRWYSREEPMVVRTTEEVTPDMLSTDTVSPAPLQDRIEAAIASPPQAGDLSQILLDIHAQSSGPVTSLGGSWNTAAQIDFRDRFISPPGIPVRSLAPSTEVRTYEYWRAVMLAESHQDPPNHQAVIDTFQSHFQSYGIPEHSRMRSSPVPSSSSSTSTSPGTSTLMYPRKSVMTTLFPSLLATLHTDELVRFHREYLAQAARLPPVLRPDGPIHNIFVRQIANRISVHAGIAAIKSIVAHGYDPASWAMTSILLVYGRSSRYDDMFRMLEGMERGDLFDFELDTGAERIAMPPPTRETYDWLAHAIATKRNKADVAEEVLSRKEAYFGPEVADGQAAVSEDRDVATATGLVAAHDTLVVEL